MGEWNGPGKEGLGREGAEEERLRESEGNCKDSWERVGSWRKQRERDGRKWVGVEERVGKMVLEGKEK